MLTKTKPAPAKAKTVRPKAVPKTPSVAAKKVDGALTGLYDNVLTGWAINSQDPEQRVVIEIYVDGACVGVVRADQEQPADVEGDGFHGFSFDIKGSWLGGAKQISARIANQGPWLAPAITLPATTPSTQLPPQASSVQSNGLCLKGWAYDPANTGKELTIRARIGDNMVATALADRPAPALVNSRDADHGFELNLPWALADGTTHEIIVETIEGFALTGSPITLCVRPEGLEANVRKVLEHQNSPSNESAEDLLLALAQQEDRRYPGSCGFDHYPQWHALFQQPAPIKSTPGKVFVLLLGDGNPEDEQRSRTSIAQQRLPAEQIEVICPKVGDLVKTLKACSKDTAVFVPLMRGDRLAPHALDTLLSNLAEQQADWGYADCDQDSPNAERSNPWFKPAWDATLFESMDLITPGGAFTNAALSKALATLKPKTNAKANWPQLLKAIAATSTNKVLHIPQVLYHRSATASAMPTAQTPSWPAPEQWPTVSLIIPTRDQLHHLKPCIHGLLNNTSYPNLELIVVDNDSHEPDTLAYLKDIKKQGVTVLRYPKAFNYAAINNWAVEQANGEVIGLINNDITIIEPNWLKTMVTQLCRPNVGAVGAKLLWPNGMVQHGGVVVGTLGLAAHTGNNLYQDDPGYLNFNQVTREQSAVTAACLLVRKADYQAHNGLDADKFPVTFNDVDFCLRLRQTGKTIVWAADAVLTHAESASRGKEDRPDKKERARREQAHFIKTWHAHMTADRYYHPALANDFLNGPYGALACPPGPLNTRL